MKIVNHRLCHQDGTPYPCVASPNKGGKMQPRYLIMHFTAGRGFDSAVKWLSNPQAKASVHLVLGRDGQMTQLVPFNIVAWYAGVSAWQGVTGLNSASLGIELDNAGQLEREGGRWRTWFKEVYPDDVLEAVHKHNPLGDAPSGWHIYTPSQIDAALEVAVVLVHHYGLRDVVGHEDIAPKRKSDPGPAFPMASFRARVLGRAEDEETRDRYETTAELTIRSGPGTQHPPLPGSPLPPGTRVQVFATHDGWRQVDVLSVVNGVMDLEGWVHSRYWQSIGRSARGSAVHGMRGLVHGIST